MHERQIFFADVITVVCFWLYNAKHDRAEMRAQQASQVTAVNPVSTASQSDPEQDPPHEASSVVYELPTSKDTGDLAMEWVSGSTMNVLPNLAILLRSKVDFPH